MTNTTPEAAAKLAAAEARYTAAASAFDAGDPLTQIEYDAAQVEVRELRAIVAAEFAAEDSAVYAIAYAASTGAPESSPLARYIAHVDGYTARDLLNLAEVPNGDAYTGPADADGKRALTVGADMLDTVWCNFRDALNGADSWDDAQGSQLADDAHEWADGAVPIYNHDRARALLDLQAWDEDTSELGEAGDIITTIGWALYGIANRLAHALVQEFEDADRNDYAGPDGTHERGEALPEFMPGETFAMYGETWRYNGQHDWQRIAGSDGSADRTSPNFESVGTMDDWEMTRQHFTFDA